MKLYYSPGSIAVASLVTLKEVGAEFEPVRVDLKNGEQTKPAYHAINPKGRVPALATDHGILTETIAILEYVGAPLIPGDRWKAARMREVMTYLASTAHVNHAHKMRGHRWADQPASLADMTAKVPKTMTASAAYIEDKLTRPFVLGDDVTLADPYLYAIASWFAGDGVDVAAFPKVTAFLAAMEKRPSVQAARAAGWIL